MAETYLAARGLDEETIDYWQLGYVYEPLPGHERFKGYLSIPYVTRAGTVSIRFRCLRDHACETHGKYDAETGSGIYLFGAQSFWIDSPVLCVTEGELDAVACSVAGLPAIGIPGGLNFKSHWQYCLEGYEEILVLQDGAKEGDRARERFASNVSDACSNSRVITFPPGQDVNSYLVEHGPEILRKKVLGDGG